MGKIPKVVLALTASAIFFRGGEMQAQQTQEKIKVVLGTATPGGGFPLYGQAFADTINETDPTLSIETKNTKGSTENIPLLEEGKLDLGLVQGEAAHEAFLGSKQRKPTPLKIIAAMYPTAGMFIVRADSPVRSIRDLVGKPVAFGARGSGLVILSRYVLDGLGLDQDKDFQAVYLERAGDGPEMVQDGRVAALWGGGVGWPGFTKLMGSPGGARFVAPSAEEIKTIREKHPFLKEVTMPANSYPGQSEPVHSVGSWSFVLARPTLDMDVAYRIARALHKAEPLIGQKLAQAKETTLANTIKAAPTPDMIHPGVLRYMIEHGLLR
jgi:TRAP transporter TAXI family solute receptor